MAKKTIRQQAKAMLKNVSKEIVRLENYISKKPDSWTDSEAHERMSTKIDVLNDFMQELDELLLNL